MYTIRYNRSTNHIEGLSAATKSSGADLGDRVAYYPESACSGLTNGYLANGRSLEDLGEMVNAVKINAEVNGRKVCKNCLKAAEKMLASN